MDKCDKGYYSGSGYSFPSYRDSKPGCAYSSDYVYRHYNKTGAGYSDQHRSYSVCNDRILFRGGKYIHTNLGIGVTQRVRVPNLLYFFGGKLI